MGRSLRLLVLLAAATTSGCARVVQYAVQDVTHALVDEEGPPGATGPYSASPYDANRRPPLDDDRPERTTSGIQYAPTLDWRMGIAPLPYAPGQSIFEGMAVNGMACQSVPMGLAQTFSGPTGPAARPMYQWGPIEVGVAGPDGSFDARTSWTRHALAENAMASGARMASRGPSCSTRVYLYLRLGRTDDAVSVLR